ncbi:MAG: HIT domain-containing protein [Phycisphaeraceae bacterium]
MSDANLWAPWRMQYIRGLGDKPDAKTSGGGGGSFLADYWASPEKDRENMVLHRSVHAMILLNRYPYTNGHLMVAPGRAVADLTMLGREERADLMELIVLAERLLTAAMNPQGVNIGINIGKCAGAGLPGHLHVHLVPRWAGDTNFMSVIGSVRVVPQALEEVYEELAGVLPKVISD